MDKLLGQKILITGPAGKLALPLSTELAADNDVWGIARFSDVESRDRCEALGITTRAIDLSEGDFGDLPRDFDYVLHFAAVIDSGMDFERALRINAEGTGLLMKHCQKAKACLIVSTGAVYSLNSSPEHLYKEDDPLGGGSHPAPTYAISKIAQEAVARSAARQYKLPTTIARMNASYSSSAGMPVRHLDNLVKGIPIVIPNSDPAVFSPIHQDDINAQVPRLLSVASIPATILNWAGDDVVSVEEWCRYMASLAKMEVNFDYRDIGLKSLANDNSLRRSLIGECRVNWREGLRRVFAERYPSEKSL
tara:strand:+ start:3167 stop:4087 length:921 start_codon:yes stop_codon:yes gene_type:complete